MDIKYNKIGLKSLYQIISKVWGLRRMYTSFRQKNISISKKFKN